MFYGNTNKRFDLSIGLELMYKHVGLSNEKFDSYVKGRIVF